MSVLTNKKVLIISKTIKFSCFLGAVHGTIRGEVFDQGTSVFPAHITAESNLGGGSFDIDLKGNEEITEKIEGATIKITISDWQVSASKLSFHIKAVAKKGFLSCTIVDETFSGSRHNAEAFKLLMASFDKKLEALA